MNFKDSKAIYLQIAERICDTILLGGHREDERIPSVREYAATVEVNFNTVMRSFDYLQSAGIIFNRRGIGYFVTPGAGEKIHQMRKKIFLENEISDFFRQIDMLEIPMDEIAEMYNTYKKQQQITNLT
jgi:DNA-binding transcriptional regulator YhcF (GntR family)